MQSPLVSQLPTQEKYVAFVEFSGKNITFNEEWLYLKRCFPI